MSSTSTSSLPTTTRQWIVAETPGANIDISKVFKLRTTSLFTADVPNWEAATSHVLIRTRWLSNDPAQRTWISPYEDDRHYTTPTRPGSVMPAGAVGEIIYSTHDSYTAGEIVQGFWGWTEYVLIKPAELSAGGMSPSVLHKVPADIDPVDYLALGLTAYTAYAGLLKVGECTPKDKTIVVSAAAGATGSTVVQLAKHVLGCSRVIALAGSDEKCQLLRETCGADIALNYKSANFAREFEDATPEYVDVYFDNVGTSLDMVARRIARGGRVVTCGAIGFYDRGEDAVALTAGGYAQILFQQAHIRGFIVSSYMDKIGEMNEDLNKWVREGKLTPLKTPWKASFEQIPEGMVMLLRGENVGKLVTVLE